MKMSIVEIAKIAEVSTATVSRVINNDPKVKTETRDKVNEVIKKYNFNPNILARNFVKQTTSTIGLIMPDLVDEFFTEIIRGVDEVAYQKNYHLMVSSTHGDKTMKESILNFMGNGLVDGFILMAPSIDDSVKKVLRTKNFPVVLINAKQEIDNCDTVSIDNQIGAFEMVNYLLEKGYKKIAHISGPLDNNDAARRLKGYNQSLSEKSIKTNSNWIVQSDFTIKGGYAACEKLMKLKNRPEVIFAANDMMAIGCYNYLSENNFTIPEDVALAGFDNIFISRYLSPKLTTVDSPISEVGKTAADLLFERLNEPNREVERIKISTSLMIRQSA